MIFRRLFAQPYIFLEENLMGSLSIGQRGSLDQPQPEQSNPLQLAQALNPQALGIDERAPGVKQPISDNREHPVNSLDSSVYFSRTGNLAGLAPERQTEVLANTMRSLGPGKVLLIETTGPLQGSYVEELRKSLPKALEMVPPSERPEIRFFVSDGRPVMASAARPDAPHNAFADYLQGLNNQQRGSGIVYADRSLPNVDRAIPNWGNPQVVDHFIRERIEPTIAFAKELGIKSVVVDDHIGVPPDNKGKDIFPMSAFKKANGLAEDASSDRQVQNIITGVYGQVMGKIHDAGLNAGLSSAADPAGSLRFGIDMTKLAPLANTIEIQGYRTEASQVQAMTNKLYDNIRDNFDQYKGVKEFKIALTTRANGVDLSEPELIRQQRVIDTFQEQLSALYKERGVQKPPDVSTSLWAHQHFYK
jgi:hypothetical protein